MILEAVVKKVDAVIQVTLHAAAEETKTVVLQEAVATEELLLVEFPARTVSIMPEEIAVDTQTFLQVVIAVLEETMLIKIVATI